MKNRKYQRFCRLLPFFAFCLLIFTLINCDLFKPVDHDFFKKIDEEIAWANSRKLAVSVAYPNDWGLSPQITGCLDNVRTKEGPRKGYPFNVEFTANSGYGFIEWMAFSSEYSLAAIQLMPLETARDNSLKPPDVKITSAEETNTGAMASTVTINIATPVTLVPFCDIRPRLDRRTNPPLNPIQGAFPYNQTINLWFTMPVNQESAAGNIRISAMHLSDENLFGKRRGEMFGIDGDISGYFRMEFPSQNRIDLIPVNSGDYPSIHLALLAITVEVGPDIESTNGILMGIKEDVSYQTDTSEVQKAYKPGVISASRTEEGGYFNDSVPWNRPDIDRRFNRDIPAPNNFNTVYIKFSITPPEDAPSPTPNRISVIERLAYDLRGFNAGGSVEHHYATSDSKVNYNTGTGEYTITHSLATVPPGIIQLVVLPWYDDTSTPVLPLPPDNAVAIGQYVTVVMDIAPPELLAHNASLNTPSSMESGTGIYVYGQGSSITLTLGGLAGLIDNGGQGGRDAASAWSLPWTMDDTNSLYWYVQIGEDNDLEKIASPRLNVYNGTALNNTWTPNDITGLLYTGGYRVLVKFEDRMGNVSPVWIDTDLRLKYSDDKVNSVSKLRAQVNAAGDSVTVTWDEPDTYLYPELLVHRYHTSPQGDVFESEIVRNTFNGQHADGGSFSVQLINSGNVKNGTAVSDVYGYEITVITHNIAGFAETEPIKVYNIPGMDVTAANTVYINEQLKMSNEQIRDLVTDDAITNIVLTSNITFNDWQPVDLSSQIFYGNGHTITVSNNFAAASNTGIFGTVQGANAEIRDLRVYYAVEVSANTSRYTGGIAGTAGADAKITNCIVDGAGLSVNNSTTAAGLEVALGGIVGSMQNNVVISNAYVSLNITLIRNMDGSICAGGTAGQISSGSNPATGTPILLNINVLSDVTCYKNGDYINNIYAGGITGSCASNGGKLQNISYGGTLTLYRDASVQQPDNTYSNLYGGGIAGAWANPLMENCIFERSGKITVPKDNSYQVFIGGLGGSLGNNGSINSCFARGDIDVRVNAAYCYTGGIIGYLGETSTITRLYLDDCIYEQGEIFCKSGADSNTVRIGGFIGYIVRESSITNCFSHAAKIEMDIPAGGLEAGGFVGLPVNATIRDCGNSSPLLLSETSNPGGTVFMGGFFGIYRVGIESSAEILENCWSTGSVSSRGADSLYTGGLIGSVNGAGDNIQIMQCWTNGNVSAVSTSSINNFFTGGFIGYVQNDAAISESWASGSVTAVRTAGANAVYAGGLVGGVSGGIASINNCYSLGNVLADKTSDGAGSIQAGGLIGNFSGNEALYNFAEGSVTAKQSGDGSIMAGGLIGSAGGSINNCYSLGNVLADKTGTGAGLIDAGGLIGYLGAGTAQYNFAKGSVTAQNKGTDLTYSGGIVARNNGGTLSNNAALGPSVTAKGSNGTRVAARVYGIPVSGVGCSDNYALDSMRIERSDDYGAFFFPFWDGVAPAPLTYYTLSNSAVHTARDGASVSSSAFQNQVIWALIGFGSEWDFSGLVRDGHPRLKNVKKEQ
ncbi:MAG: hypothetical protein FWH41_02195 [Treponema sp.]|nr:hypothetical protein [Treponema sp.]